MIFGIHYTMNMEHTGPYFRQHVVGIPVSSLWEWGGETGELEPGRDLGMGGVLEAGEERAKSKRFLR